MTARFQLRLFGAPSIEGPEGALSGPAAQPRRLALLARLALADRRRLTRDKLTATFWPESDPERARHSLADAVYVLRRELGAGALRSEGDDLVLEPARVASDVEAFRRDVARGALEEAASRYAGPFLDGFHVGGAPAFERWVDLERARLAEEHARVLERLATRAGEEGAHREAARWWRRLAASDPLNARTALRLMEALAASGDRAGAIRHAEAHARRLAEELKAEADPEVEALAERLRRAPVPAAATSTGTAPPTHTAAAAEGAVRYPAEPLRTDEGPARASSRPESARTPGPPAEPRASRRTRRRWLAAGVAAGTAVLALAGTLLTVAADRAPATTADRIVVLPFQSPAEDPGLRDTGALAAGLLAEGLARVGLTEVVLPLEMAEVAGVGKGPVATPPSVAEAASAFGAGLAVRGTVHRAGDSLVLVTTVLRTDGSTAGGEVVAALPALKADPRDPTPALAALRDRVAGAVAAHLGRDPPAHPFVVPTPTWASYRVADRATRHFLAREFDQAAALYREAAELDPSTPAYRLWEAIAHANLGRWERVARMLEELRPRRAELTGFEAAEFDWLEATTRGDRAAALEAARTARAHAPHCGLGGYQLAVELYRSGLTEEALEVLESLDPDRGWLADWGRYWYRLALVHHLLGQHARELEAAEEGYARHPSWWMLEARLRALAALGRTEELRALLRTSPEASPDVYRRAAWALRIHGYPEEGAEVALEGLRALRSPRSDAPRDVNARLLEARLLFGADSLPPARKLLEALADEAPENPLIVGWWGVVEARLGHREAAERAVRRLASLEERPFVRGLHTAWRAAIEAELGAAVERVRGLLIQAHREGVGFDRYHLTPLFDGVRDEGGVREVFMVQGQARDLGS